MLQRIGDAVHDEYGFLWRVEQDAAAGHHRGRWHGLGGLLARWLSYGSNMGTPLTSQNRCASGTALVHPEQTTHTTRVGRM